MHKSSAFIPKPTNCIDTEWNDKSYEAKHLITLMLSSEDKRPTAKECLDHPWFKLDSESLSKRCLSSRAIINIQNFSSKETITKLILNLICYRCKLEEEIEKYQVVFKELDEEKNGYIEVNQLAKVLNRKIKDQTTLRNVISSLDLDHDGKIYWSEFISIILTPNLIVTNANLQDVFTYFDQERKGFFTAQDVFQLLHDEMLGGMKQEEFFFAMKDSFPDPNLISFKNLVDFMCNQSDQ